MTTVYIPTQNTAFAANDASTDYVLAAGTVLQSATNAIDATATAAGRTFTIKGEVTASQNGLVLGQLASPSSSADVTLGTTAQVHVTQAGISNYSDDSNFTNMGVLTGQTGIQSTGEGNHFTNSGLIAASGFAMLLAGGGNDVRNTGTISGIHGVYINSVDGDLETVWNSGTISGGYNAIYGAAGKEKVVNSGKLYGDVMLSAGDDTFVNKGHGFVTGKIHGGADNDTYIVNRADLDLVEMSNNGSRDTVRSSVSFTLDDNFEYLYLTGAKNLNGHGNGVNNYLQGNAGDNKLSGLDGQDALFGGKGTDYLTGGTGSDGFYFRSHADKEIVTDFHDGEDKLIFFGPQSMTVQDLLDHHAHQAGNDLVLSYDGTEMILKGIHRADITAGDFDV